MSHLQHYKYVREYDKTAVIPESLIDSLLQRTWKITPSKNNFMPYMVHVIGPKHQIIKDKVYKNCLANEKIDDVENVRYKTHKPNYWNITNCSYLLMFTQRVEEQPNPYQTYLINQGYPYEQTGNDLSKFRGNATLEIGMFATTFATLCLESKLDISFTLCFLKDLKHWQDEEFKFLTQEPILLMTVGKGLRYRVHEFGENMRFDLKPDYARIVNFINS
jgi:hypothetical protein